MPWSPPVHRPPGHKTRAESERDRKRQFDRKRGKTAERGYDALWRKVRAVKLAQSPLCECDECQAGRIRVREAKVVDHIVPISERPDLRLDLSNLRSMAKPCHDKRTALEQGFAAGPATQRPEWLKPAAVPVVVVCGPPAAGKTRYVAERKGGDDLVIDLDSVVAALSGESRRDWDRNLWLAPATRARNALLSKLSSSHCAWPRAWLIMGAAKAETREWWERTLQPAEIVVLETLPATCIQRIHADAARQGIAAAQCEAVRDWWLKYRPRAGETVKRADVPIADHEGGRGSNL